MKAKNSWYDRWKQNLDVEDVMQEENTFIEESYTSKLFLKQTKSSNTRQLPPQNFVPFVKPFDASDGVLNRDLGGSSTNNEVLDSYALSPGDVTNHGCMGSLVAGETGVLSRIDETFIEVDDGCLLGQWRLLANLHHGVVAWPITDQEIGHQPTAALMHPGMFAAIHTLKHLYDFHLMSDPGAILLYNRDGVHKELMKPWLTCSLAHHCIQPIGAQDTGCRYDKKPLFRYSCCHLYDTSAFNVALSLMFGPHNHPCQPVAPAFFTRIPVTMIPVASTITQPLSSHHLSLPSSHSTNLFTRLHKNQFRFRVSGFPQRNTTSYGSGSYGNSKSLSGVVNDTGFFMLVSNNCVNNVSNRNSINEIN